MLQPDYRTPRWQQRLPIDVELPTAGVVPTEDWFRLDPVREVLFLSLPIGSFQSRVFSVQTANGVSQELIRDDDYRFGLYAHYRNRLLVIAERVRGSASREIWSVRLPDGKVDWRKPLYNQLNPPPGKLYEALVIFQNRLLLLEMQAEERKLISQQLDPNSGQLLGTGSLSLREANWVGMVQAGEEVFISSRRVYQLSGREGSAAIVWP
ncbi:MAG: hypothetical protein HC880_01040 [Bacteroidia bacterium]|nr:hypothetical protein [Bacteroidia bacterium]